MRAARFHGRRDIRIEEVPEPRLGAADTRCDVNALGVQLYKLLTGVLPIDVGSDGIAAAVGRICSQQPPKLGAHDRRGLIAGTLSVLEGK